MEKDFKFDISVDAWIQCINVSASSLEEAREKLCSMDLNELVREGYVKDFTIGHVDVEYEKEIDEDD